MDARVLIEDDEEPLGFDWSKLVKAKPTEMAGARFGPKFGGLFLAFPAVLPATLTLIEKKQGTTKAWADASGGVLGAVGLAAFAFTALMVLRTNPLIALLLALVAWLFVGGGLCFLFRMTGLFVKQDELLMKSR
jgi:Protein of unknown function (DUF3147)